MIDRPTWTTQSVTNRNTWESYCLPQLPDSILQSWDWGELKAGFGWHPERLALLKEGKVQAKAQVLFRKVSPFFTVAYLPKAPIVDWARQDQVQVLLHGIHKLCRRRRSIFLKIEPLLPDQAQNRDRICEHGFNVSHFTVQPPRTILVDIKSDETDILAAMKQKTRYNIRLASRKGVNVRLGTPDDIPAFFRLMEITGERDQFGIHSLEYFQTAFNLFAPDRAALLLAELEREALAALMIFTQGRTAYYLFGASSNKHRSKMPAYLLQWEAMRWAKSHGCETYDLWGIPDADEATLESEFTRPDHQNSGLWGVYRFKRGFGGKICRDVGAFDYVYNQRLYWVYRRWAARRRGDFA